MSDSAELSERPFAFPDHPELGFRLFLPASWEINQHQLDDFALSANPTLLIERQTPDGGPTFSVAVRLRPTKGALPDWAREIAGELGIEISPYTFGEFQLGPTTGWKIDGTFGAAGSTHSTRLFLYFAGERIFMAQISASHDEFAAIDSLCNSVLGTIYLAKPQAPKLTISAPGSKPAIKAPRTPKTSVAKAKKAELQRAAMPTWWTQALELEQQGKVTEAEATIRNALPYAGVILSLADMFRQRMQRLLKQGDLEGAAQAHKRAERAAYEYASNATSGGEGAAMSLERDRFLEQLGPSPIPPKPVGANWFNEAVELAWQNDLADALELVQRAAAPGQYGLRAAELHQALMQRWIGKGDLQKARESHEQARLWIELYGQDPTRGASAEPRSQNKREFLNRLGPRP